MGRFDLVQPSLIQQLKSILDQYQDDGQILKELIQNAEDARATEVKFLLDETQHDVKSKLLHHPDLAHYQGPALYAYNNAQFAEQDWLGLKMISDSVKKSDALKVGQFGLGFKSVFHMTDLPSVISAEKLSFIDPHERFFTEEGKKVTGFTWHLKDDYKSMKKISSQFDAYRGLFGCTEATFKQGHYNGTLFRFPLRTKESQLSSNLYNPAKVQQIFRSFESIADMVLLFLTSIESIELYKRSHNQLQPELLFKVQISPESLAAVRQHRQAFLSSFIGGHPLSDAKVCFPICIDMIRYQGFKASKTSQTYLVSHFCAGKASLSAEITALLGDLSMTYMPWVGAAAPLVPSKVSASSPNGHVFCFLPLPLQRGSMSGLPVHVNGFFAISSNRHQLKWPSIKTSTEPSESTVTDKSCLWNERVLEEVLPKAIFYLIVEAIALCKQSHLTTGSQLGVDFIHSLIPDPDAVTDRWKGVLPTLYRLLSKVEFIMAESSKSWLPWEKVILLRNGNAEELPAQNVLLKSLALAGVNAAVLPSHLAKVLTSYISATEMFATPELMRLLLRKKPEVLKSLSSEDCVLLLGYLLTDSQYIQLDGLPLLPLQDGSLATFSSNASFPHVFIPCDAHPASVLPMMENRFVDISNRIPDKVLLHLKAIAKQESLQLRQFSAKIFLSLLPKVLTDTTLMDMFYAEGLWEYIASHFTDLMPFEGLPLLPTVADCSKPKVLPLLRTAPVLSRTISDSQVTDLDLIVGLENLGVRFVLEIPKFLVSSALLRDKYVFLPTAKGVKDTLKAYITAGTFTLADLRKLTATQRVALRLILSKLTLADLHSDDMGFLRDLPVFRVLSAQELFSSARETNLAAPFDPPPLPSAFKALDVSDSASLALSELLGVRQTSRASLLTDHVIPLLEQQVFSQEETTQLMLSVLQNLNSYQSERNDLLGQLSTLPFLTREDGYIVTPKECFNPMDPLLSRLLQGEGLFPDKIFGHANVIEALQTLGLKGAASITPADLVCTARRVEEMAIESACDWTTLSEKSSCLLLYLSDHPELFSLDKALKKQLENISWVVPRRSPPSSYPHSLDWHRSGIHAVTPDSVTADRFASVVGSVMPILQENVSDKLADVFAWNKEPSLLHVVEHLKNAIHSYRANEKGAYMNMLVDIYHILAQIPHSQLRKILQERELSMWVWHGDGFTCPDRVVLQRLQTAYAPFIYHLPTEMSEFADLFHEAGAWSHCEDDMLLEILNLVQDKYKQMEMFDSEEVMSDLHLVVDIIHKLKPEEGHSFSASVKQRLLLPVLTENQHSLSLAPISECTFSDTDWLNERRLQLEGNDSILFVHPSISNELAEQLGVPSLVNRMLDTDVFEIGESFGQSEPLTRRLHNLLQEYADGFAVPKELIQNADDAGATEIRFLYDERTNQDALSCLLDDGMKECQGPAMWVYNNAVFTDADFDAIIKLSGATKSSHTEKIGGFGLGFNAVYNLTDVPSFISRNYCVIFDPHTTHLGKTISDASKPGIKIDLKKNHKALGTLKNQFKPFSGVFGCDLKHKGRGISYDGTLFRFPLRTQEQATKSEICNVHYDRKQVLGLLEMLAASCDSLLLFTQNVRKVSVYHVSDKENPENANLLFTVCKEPVKYIRTLRVPVNLPATVKDFTEDEQEFTRQSSILKAATTTIQDYKQKRSSRYLNVRLQRLSSSSNSSKPSLPESSYLLKIRYKQTSTGCNLLRPLEGAMDSSVTWIVTSTMGEGDALELALKREGLTPVGGVAVPLERNGKGFLGPYVLRDTQTDSYDGSIFCYLPMPIKSGLPVHINGAFAVTSNRRQLVVRVSDNKSNDLVEWNECLMADSVCKAYVLMLEDLRGILSSPEDYPFHLLWPRSQTAAANCRTLINTFYTRLCSSVTETLFSRKGIWVSLSNALLLDSEIQQSPIATQAFAVLDQCMSSSREVVIDLPEDVKVGFIKAGCEQRIKERTLSRGHLYEKMFFPHILEFSSNLRDTMVLYALDLHDKSLNNMIRSHACIPVTPDGKSLSFVQDLINPSSPLAQLYSPADGRFPYGTRDSYLSPQRLATMETLGMLGSDLPDTEVLERARSVLACYRQDRRAGLARIAHLLQYIDGKLSSHPDLFNDIKSAMRQTSFLPFVKKSAEMTLFLQGDREVSPLLSPERLFCTEHSSLLCFVEPILDTEAIGIIVSQKLLSFLGLDRKPQIQQVLMQLRYIQEHENEAIQSYQLCKKCCYDIYQFLQDEKFECALVDLGAFILIGNRLVAGQQVALQGARDCSPYLYDLPYELTKFEQVFRRANMKERFEIADFLQTMKQINEDFKDKTLGSRDLQVVLNVATLLNNALELKGLSVTDVGSEFSAVYLPNAANQMRPASSLCFNDCNWLPDHQSMEFAHNMIPYQIAKRLGVNTKRQETLRKHARGIPFGQKEKLTKRLKRIMTSYPCGKEIFKELLQNADDAGATKIHFVKDCRQHSTEKVFEDCWKPLQGPALCVFNDKPFSKTDLEGIQNLGEGSKGQDPNRTGQYGVGFNSVYHLTDVPSFISNGPDIGHILCAFDPHCCYVPGATPDEPGRLYDNIDSMKGVFTDVFSGYLSDIFDITGATMFRFPLRNKDMASQSKISNSVVTLDTVQDLMTKFRAEMFDSLLFINNLEEISLSDILRAKKTLNETYTVKATVQPHVIQLRKEFSDHVKGISQKLKSRELQLKDVPVKEVSYQMIIEDSLGVKETWLVVQRIGYKNPAMVPQSVYHAHMSGDLFLLPRGGAACLLKREIPKGSRFADRPRKVFCFLPLPINTKLPVHINGHFALDHEARRGLWHDDDGGPRTDWNNSLISQVIVPAYQLLVEVVKDMSFPSAAGEALRIPAAEAEERLQMYHSLFPQDSCADQWQDVAHCLYRQIALSDSPLLPVLNVLPLEKMSPDVELPTSNQQVADVKWYPILGQSDNMAFFNDLPDSKDGLATDMTRALIAVGFNLLHSPLQIYKAFMTAGIQGHLINPSAIIAFLKSNRLVMPPLPMALTDTPFRNIETLKGLITFCNKLEDCLHSLEELPFGLSQDGKLRFLSNEDQLFHSVHSDLVPECSDLFLHPDLVSSSFKDVNDFGKVCVFKRFTIEEFGLYINQTLPGDFCPADSQMVSWDPDSGHKPNRTWLSKVWAFLAEMCQHIISDYGEDPLNVMDQLDAVLFSLQSWCLVPVYASSDILSPPPATENLIVGKEGSNLREISKKLSLSKTKSLNSLSSCGLDDKEHFLVPLEHAHMVMDFSQRDSMTDAMRQALKKLKVPELHHKIVDGKSIGTPTKGKTPAVASSQFAKLLCAKVSDPRSVLECISYAVTRAAKFDQDIGMSLHASECNLLLKYLSDAIEHKQLRGGQEVITMLRRLPFYISLSGNQTDLGEYKVYILPQGIPSTEIDVWRSKAGVLFLQRNDLLQPLYELLGCKALSDIEVYCQFIFDHFEYLSDEARIIHLTYIRDRKLPQLTEDERDILLGRLTSLRFIRDAEGKLHPTCDYYDPENRLFQLMLDKGCFPPSPFDNYRWVRFLRLIGLNCEVNQDKFVEFAEQIAELGKQLPEADAVEKSKVLVQELFKCKNLASLDTLLEKVQEIPFLCAADAHSKYHEFCPQYGFSDADVAFIKFKDAMPNTIDNVRCAWTSAYFLPHWADPSQMKSSEFNFDYHPSDPLSSLENYQQELSRLLGIKLVPSIDQTMQHIKNISACFESDEVKKTLAEKAETLEGVMYSIYKYLQTHAMSTNKARQELQDIRCILIEGGRRMVKAKQLVVNLYEEQQIRPYLYKTPAALSEFNNLFRYLGATDRTTVEQYATVLDQLYAENLDEKLHPNSLRCAYRAVKGIFSILSKIDNVVQLQTLYLPGQDACLRPARDLVYIDEHSYTERLMNFDLPFLVDLRECKLHISYFSDTVSKLPANLQPMMLTDIVEECLQDDCKESKTTFGAAQILKNRLTSTEFTAGILRLIRHDHLERAEKPKAAALKAVQRALKNVRVVAVDELTTYLKYDGKKILSSESEAECFVTKVVENGTPLWYLYVQVSVEVSPELLVKVAEIVNKIAGGLLQNSTIYLHPILSCNTYEIPITLDKLRIRQDHQSARTPTLQPPGSFVPLDLHHLLRQDFVEFEVDEYVGYELDDPEMNNKQGSATYIYAIILEKLPMECAMYDRNTQKFFDRYRINIGDDQLPLIVSSIDLYRLHRVIEKKSRQRSLSVSSHVSEVFVDSAILQVENGDYLLLSPGVLPSMADQEINGVIVQESIAEEDEDQNLDDADTLAQNGNDLDGEMVRNETIAEQNESQNERYTEIWEETETVYTELHVNTSTPIKQPSMNGNHEVPKQVPTVEPQPRQAQKVQPAQASDPAAQANLDIGKLDYPDITEQNVPEIKKTLNKQVRAIWKLPEEQRKKVIKRLMLKFHPDKNPDKSELCTQLTQHIRAIIEDIEGGGFVADKENRGDWWSEFINRRAKTYGEQKDDFESKLKETFAKYASTLGPEFGSTNGYDASESQKKFQKFKKANRRNPQPAEARRWLKQAQADLKSAYSDFNAEDPAMEWVLYKVHQCAEKALKAGCFTLDAKKVNLTDLKLISNQLHDSEVSDHAKQLQELIGQHDHVTYPGSVNFPKIPHELHSEEKALQALDLCEKLIERISSEFIESMERDLSGETTARADIFTGAASMAVVLYQNPRRSPNEVSINITSFEPPVVVPEVAQAGELPNSV